MGPEQASPTNQKCSQNAWAPKSTLRIPTVIVSCPLLDRSNFAIRHEAALLPAQTSAAVASMSPTFAVLRLAQISGTLPASRPSPA